MSMSRNTSLTMRFHREDGQKNKYAMVIGKGGGRGGHVWRLLLEKDGYCLEFYSCNTMLGRGIEPRDKTNYRHIYL